MWVEANFKETQLTKMRIGQPVEVHADLYGGDVTYDGTIASLGMGTGSAFPLLPAQNASGNWIKIVRSEEHTSELQSLMRISYAVFCLNKTNDTITYNKNQ